jgi:DNA-binding NarL/FixJ family response regulator
MDGVEANGRVRLMRSIRILIADDHGLVRAGFSGLLGRLAGVEVVGEAADGLQAWSLIRELQPDLALVDIAMPGLDGIELTARVVAQQPATRVILLSMHTAEGYVRRALMAGSAGYLLKDTTLEELEKAIRAVSRRGTFYSPRVLEALSEAGQRADTAASRLKALTPRQRQLLQLIGEGRSTREIAESLAISVKTAETHRTQLMKRLDVHDIAAVVRFAIQSGLVDPEV